MVSCLNVQAVLSETSEKDSTEPVSENASTWQEVQRTSDSPCFRRLLGTSSSPFPLKTKQGKMGLNFSKGDLGQIEEKPTVGATGTGTLGADGISFPGDLWKQVPASGLIIAGAPWSRGRRTRADPAGVRSSSAAHRSAAPQHPLTESRRTDYT